MTLECMDDFTSCSIPDFGRRVGTYNALDTTILPSNVQNIPALAIIEASGEN